jgi:quercetin dioxygenase-like cupin family protein
MKINLSRNKLFLTVGAGLALFSLVAYSATTFVLGVGTIPYSEVFDGPATVTFRTIALAPGEVSGWHYHPGAVFNVVTRGTVTVEDGCGGDEVFTQGQGFETIGGRIHRAKNLGTVESFEYNAFVVPEGSPITVNLPNNERLCGPPRSVPECKDGGWMAFSHPRRFANQGDCLGFVRRGD